MTDAKDERITKIQTAAKQRHAVGAANLALEVIGERDQRIAELERENARLNSGLRLAQHLTGRWQSDHDAAERRADALERALRNLEHAGRMQHEVWGASQELVNALLEACAALTNQPAQDDEPSCCARTREECARVADAYPEHTPFGPDYTAHGLVGSGQNSARRDIAAAIRRTDKDA